MVGHLAYILGCWLSANSAQTFQQFCAGRKNVGRFSEAASMQQAVYNAADRGCIRLITWSNGAKKIMANREMSHFVSVQAHDPFTILPRHHTNSKLVPKQDRSRPWPRRNHRPLLRILFQGARTQIEPGRILVRIAIEELKQAVCVRWLGTTATTERTNSSWPGFGKAEQHATDHTQPRACCAKINASLRFWFHGVLGQSLFLTVESGS